MIKIKFNITYFLLTLWLFIAEVFIATKLKDIFFVRAYLGDVIVVILLYTFIKSVFIIHNNNRLIAGIFIFSCLIEFAQYFNIAERLGFQRGSLMYIVIGNSFSWVDILCYLAGCVLMFLLLKVKSKK
ncbi:ribosomal maturation YjgA family protein [Chryseobacterium gregarium]|uniref:ribosomal maturation YjgA family protein n=1 Tax=Chryseobacterium gregarium TaxID=456299 RepID=UPI00040683FF|nr:DUF2809 domain-containing protein [Chryseobacterium gregarium]